MVHTFKERVSTVLHLFHAIKGNCVGKNTEGNCMTLSLHLSMSFVLHCVFFGWRDCPFIPYIGIFLVFTCGVLFCVYYGIVIFGPLYTKKLPHISLFEFFAAYHRLYLVFLLNWLRTIVCITTAFWFILCLENQTC